MKKAFTMIELVFVIVIVGILSAMIAPSFGGNNLREAADQVISHIRYTQHLAMMDNKFDSSDPTWFKGRWQISFGRALGGNDIWPYTIFSDNSNHDKNANLTNEIAIDPLSPGVLNSAGQMIADSGHYLSGGANGVLNFGDSRITTNMQLKKKYGVQKVLFSGTCTNNQSNNQSRRIIFDSIGRPYYSYKKDSSSMASNPYGDMKLLKSQCQISLCQNYPCDDKNITIAIEPETGYAHIKKKI